MILTKSCIYGLRASLLLAMNRSGDYISIREVSDRLGISFHFLTKVLQQLTAAGIMESFKGPQGGIRLSKPGEEIPLLDIVIAIDGDDLLTQCILGLPGCGVKKPCSLHEMWSATKEDVIQMLQSTNLTELAQQTKNGGLRISDNSEFEWEFF